MVRNSPALDHQVLVPCFDVMRMVSSTQICYQDLVVVGTLFWFH